MLLPLFGIFVGCSFLAVVGFTLLTLAGNFSARNLTVFIAGGLGSAIFVAGLCGYIQRWIPLEPFRSAFGVASTAAMIVAAVKAGNALVSRLGMAVPPLSGQDK
jgi:hypothetical protein